jgi:AraC family ethanolamine operon transcriptional activator
MSTQHTRFLDQSNLVSVVPSSFTWEQLQPGQLSIAYRVVKTGPLVISSRDVNLAYHVHAQVVPERSGFMAVVSDRESYWRGTSFDHQRLAVGNEIDMRTMGPSTLLGVAVDQPELQAKCPDSLDASDLVDRLSRNKVLHKPAASARFRAAVNSVCSSPAAPPPATSDALIPLLAAMLDEIDEHSVERSLCLNRRYAAVRTCQRYMRENVDDTVTLLDLSRACGMRSRSLINAFEAIAGFSPMDYLKRLRLTAVYSSLAQSDARSTKVIDVAMEWGFWHMGHFARDYRVMFGEAPSQTLTESRGTFAGGP